MDALDAAEVAAGATVGFADRRPVADGVGWVENSGIFDRSPEDGERSGDAENGVRGVVRVAEDIGEHKIARK